MPRQRGLNAATSQQIVSGALLEQAGRARFALAPRARWLRSCLSHLLIPSRSFLSAHPIHLASPSKSIHTGQQHSTAVQRSRPGRIGTAFLLLTAVAIGSVSANRFSLPSKVGSRTMSSKLVPANPADVMVIRTITPNVVTFSVPFKRFGTIPIGGRGTVVRLGSGSLAVFSPVALTDEVKSKLGELGGKVKYIIATDFEHHIFITQWHKAYPEAKIVGPEGLPEKRAKQSAKDPMIGDEEFAVVFKAQDKHSIRVDDEFDKDFEYEYIESHPNKELVFFYKPDRVLVEADLMFNLPCEEQYSKCPEEGKPGFAARLFMSAQTTQGDAKGTKRLLWYLVSARDRPAFNKSIRSIDSWGFDTLIPCHGETIVGDGKAVFRKIFSWHLEANQS